MLSLSKHLASAARGNSNDASEMLQQAQHNVAADLKTVSIQ